PASQLLVAVGSTTPPRRSTLFPYTTLFRSKVEREFGDADAEVMADSDKVQQVFLNLLHNAVDAMPNGGVLTLQTQRSDTEYVLQDRKSTRLNSSHVKISYAVFCLKKKKNWR